MNHSVTKAIVLTCILGCHSSSRMATPVWKCFHSRSTTCHRNLLLPRISSMVDAEKEICQSFPVSLFISLLIMRYILIRLYCMFKHDFLDTNTIFSLARSHVCEGIRSKLLVISTMPIVCFAKKRFSLRSPDFRSTATSSLDSLSCLLFPGFDVQPKPVVLS